MKKTAIAFLVSVCVLSCLVLWEVWLAFRLHVRMCVCLVGLPRGYEPAWLLCRNGGISELIHYSHFGLPTGHQVSAGRDELVCVPSKGRVSPHR